MRDFMAHWMKFGQFHSKAFAASLGALVVLASAKPTAAATRSENAAAPEPTAGSWAPWVLSSGQQLRLDPPPGPTSSQTLTEIQELKSFQAQRSASTMAVIQKWNTGPATLPW